MNRELRLIKISKEPDAQQDAMLNDGPLVDFRSGDG